MADLLINQVQDEITQLLSDALKPETVNEVYGFRTLPDKLAKYVVVSYIGGLPTDYVTAEMRSNAEFAIGVFVRHTNNTDSLQDAERTLNDIENMIHNALGTVRSNLWFKIVFHRPSRRPASRPDTRGIRMAEIYCRAILK